MALKYPIDKVNSRYGAPMGRHTYGTPENVTGKVRLFRVPLDQGYDAGGAYWGCGQALYCACGTVEDYYLDFVRADSRKDACEKLGIDPETLRVPIGTVVFGGRYAD